MGIANKEGRTDSNEVNRILDYAYKNNINSLDTANSYGESETVLGKYIFAIISFIVGVVSLIAWTFFGLFDES